MKTKPSAWTYAVAYVVTGISHVLKLTYYRNIEKIEEKLSVRSTNVRFPMAIRFTTCALQNYYVLILVHKRTPLLQHYH